MGPRFIINKGIQKKVSARSRLFTVGDSYKAVIYNPKDLSVAIEATAVCVEGTSEDEKNKLNFTFSGDQTELLKVGYATIEIYDESQTLMAYRDNFAVIRKNSLQIVNVVDDDSESSSESEGQSSGNIGDNTEYDSDDPSNNDPVDEDEDGND